jgi:hypothetical protein
MTRSRVALAASVALAGLALTFEPRAASAAAPGGELMCRIGTSQALGTLVRAKAQCIENCEKRRFGNEETVACSPPYAGELAGCVAAAEGAAGGAMQASCATDCPECYAGGDCAADADARVADAESHVESLASQVFCDDSASTGGLTLNEFKCQRTVRKFLAKFWAAKLQCFAKCERAEAAGKAAAGSCTQPTDPRTLECLDKAEGKVASLIDNKCEPSVNPSADKPECAPYDTRNGAAWVAAEEASIDARLPGLFCDDPTPTTTLPSAPTTVPAPPTTVPSP